MIKKIKDYFRDNKEKKLLKELSKKKDEYTKLKVKFDDGTINNSELNNYYKLKEDINKMAKKFIMKEGKLVLNTEDNDNDTKAPEPQVQEPQVQQPKAQEPKVEQPKVEEPRVEESQVEQPRVEESQAQEPAQPKKENDEQLYARMKQEEQAQQQEARERYEKEVIRQQQEIQRRMYAQQQAQAQQQAMQAQSAQAQSAQAQSAQTQSAQSQVQAQKPKHIVIILSVQDMPELDIVVEEGQVQEFVANIEKAVLDNMFLQFGPYYVVANKILCYRFAIYDPRKQTGGNENAGQ